MSMSENVEQVLRDRAGGRCELCGATDALEPMPVPPVEHESAERYLLVCETCAAQIGDEEPLAEAHWFCLRDAVWSGVPAVQVMSVRLLRRLESASWARDLLGQVFLDGALQAWVDASGSSRARARRSERSRAAPSRRTAARRSRARRDHARRQGRSRGSRA